MSRVMAISGSLRVHSSNTRLLHAATLCAPREMAVVLYDGLERLPMFNPDLDGDEPPPAVLALRRDIASSDALLICSPEYARGVAGAMKNALDWLVGSVEFPGKLVAVVNASQRATDADAHLRLTLRTMDARLVHDASPVVPLLGRDWLPEVIASDPETGPRLKRILDDIAAAIGNRIPLPDHQD